MGYLLFSKPFNGNQRINKHHIFIPRFQYIYLCVAYVDVCTFQLAKRDSVKPNGSCSVENTSFNDLVNVCLLQAIHSYSNP